jgi:hypothetical protein
MASGTGAGTQSRRIGMAPRQVTAAAPDSATSSTLTPRCPTIIASSPAVPRRPTRCRNPDAISVWPDRGSLGSALSAHTMAHLTIPTTRRRPFMNCSQIV